MRNPELLESIEESEDWSLSTLRASFEDNEDIENAEEAPPGLALDQEPKPLSLLSRMALWMAPLYAACYDLQMQIGRGVREVHERVQLGHYPKDAPPLRVAFLSDLHYGPAAGRVALRQAWRLAHDARPDVVLLGGDFLYGDGSGLPSLLRELQRWKPEPPPGGIYACLGNHDHYGNREALITCLEACGVRVLLNDAVPLPEPWRDVWIAGCDDMEAGDPQPELALAGVPGGACTIMLSHSPDICDYSVLKQCALTLCGHTHGGQVCLPSGSALVMRSKWGRHYTSGLHRHAGNWVFVSRGVGTTGVPFRMWAPPDVAVLELTGTFGTRSGARHPARSVRKSRQDMSQLSVAR